MKDEIVRRAIYAYKIGRNEWLIHAVAVVDKKEFEQIQKILKGGNHTMAKTKKTKSKKAKPVAQGTKAKKRLTVKKISKK